MMKRTIFVGALSVGLLAWSGVAFADDPNSVADDAAKKTNDAAKKASDSAKKTTDTAKKKSDAATKNGKNKNTVKTTTESVGKTTGDVEGTAGTTTSKVETTGANVLAAERPDTGKGPNKPLLYGSLGLLGLSYVPAAIVGVASPKGSDSWMALPIVGPWVALGKGSNERQWTGDVAIAADGVLQGVAALGIVAAFVVPDSKLPLGMNSKLRVLPTTVGRDGYGVGAGGTF